MNRCWPTLSLLLTLFSPAVAGQADIVYTRAFPGKAYGYYHAKVLERAIALTPEYGEHRVVPHPQPMPQARQILTLENGDADVMWTVTTDEREKRMIPVRFPLLQGFAGYRVFVIQQGRQSSFPLSITDAQIRKFRAVQGNDWPDLDILRANGFDVHGTDWSDWFTSMYAMVERGVIDIFPRNIIEVHNDLARHQQRHIQLEKHHLLRYPNYEYFFVSPLTPELATRIRRGLIRMLENGELREIFLEHENHRKAVALAADPARKIHELSNPTLSYSLDYHRWLDNPEKAISALRKNP
ncbi:hypothetical protein [Alteromonas sp. H39]|uniref:hypothetical protein n=1 Tax=Alteromonas sp. H39 TaxID=3389876 RepID=UPI0039E0E91F